MLEKKKQLKEDLRLINFKKLFDSLKAGIWNDSLSGFLAQLGSYLSLEKEEDKKLLLEIKKHLQKCK
jgi:hypothetical protein